MRGLILLLGAVVVMGACPDQTNLLPNPPDPSQTGPYPVIGRTFQNFTGQERDFRIEVWYPAAAVTGPLRVYDTREHLPERYENNIPPGIVDQYCACYSDGIPGVGPFPVILFIHGSGGYRNQAMTQVTHWASRGFVVFAADHPGITLEHALDLGGGFIPDQAGDGRLMLSIIRNIGANPTLSFLDGVVDPSRIAITGQSAGAGATVAIQDEGIVLMPMSGSGTLNQGDSHFVIGGDIDRVIPYASQQASYATSSGAPKRLLGLAQSGHLGTTPDMCFVGRDEGGFIAIAIRFGISEAILFAGLYDGCEEDIHLPPEAVWPPLHFSTSAVLEETLMCDETMAGKLSQIALIYPEAVFEYQETL